MREVPFTTFDDRQAREGRSIRVELDNGTSVQGVYRAKVGHWIKIDMGYREGNRWVLDRTIVRVWAIEHEDLQPNRKRPPIRRDVSYNQISLRNLRHARRMGRPAGQRNGL